MNILQSVILLVLTASSLARHLPTNYNKEKDGSSVTVIEGGEVDQHGKHYVPPGGVHSLPGAIKKPLVIGIPVVPYPANHPHNHGAGHGQGMHSHHQDDNHNEYEHGDHGSGFPQPSYPGEQPNFPHHPYGIANPEPSHPVNFNQDVVVQNQHFGQGNYIGQSNQHIGEENSVDEGTIVGGSLEPHHESKDETDRNP